jgi:predicted acylesterase/phospholipase RssA
MPKIGLALSGGGFRGTFYHLGGIRFLRDAGILPNVTHITCVSGGSILAAHLVLNWDRYNGSGEAFDEAAKEVIDFARLDVRNRIVRRLPLLVFGQVMRWITRKPFDRRFTRTGLLERYYQTHLYGDTCLYELPAQPELHILATNLSEGCIGSFTRSGLIMERRRTAEMIEFERVNVCLATVPLAVAASSAFPGFFPPLTVHSAEIGASKSAFSLLTFTDGGVFDNLGVRAFRFIQHCWSEQCKEDEHADDRQTKFVNVEKKGSREANEHGRSAAADLGASVMRQARAGPVRKHRDPGSHRELIRQADVNRFRDSSVAELDDDREFEAESNDPVHARSRPDQERPRSGGVDAVIASDAGAKLSTTHDAFQGGLVRTAMRASDILMDRVWQLEKEIFGATPGFLFAPIHRIIEPDADPHALLPVIQRQVIGIRTDLDRFSPTEIRSLVQHGYCVMRQACRSRPDLFGDQLPDGPPWDPWPEPSPRSAPSPSRPGRAASTATALARELQQSALRRIVSTLFDWRDTMTYVFLPFILAVLLFVPCLAGWAIFHVYHDTEALRTIGATNQDAEKMIELVRDGPVSPFAGMPVSEVGHVAAPDYRGFVFLTDGHIVDLRQRGRAYQYRHFLVRRQSTADADNHLRLQFVSDASRSSFRCQDVALTPVLRRTPTLSSEGGTARRPYRYELDLDFSQVPAGTTTDVTVEVMSWDDSEEQSDLARALPHTIYGDTKVTSMWILLAERRPAGRFRLIVSSQNQPGPEHAVRPTRYFETMGGRVFGWQIVGPEPAATYEGHWLME